MAEGVGVTPAPGARVEGRRLFMSPEQLIELDWTALEEAEKVEMFKDCLYQLLDGPDACTNRVNELMDYALPALMVTLKRIVSQIMHFTEGEKAPAKATASSTHLNWGAYVSSAVNSGAQWMAKMRNMYLYRDVLIIMQILDLREKLSEPLLETITTSEEMCYMMALEDVQRLADDTNIVTKKVHGSRYLSKFEGVVEETVTDSQMRALKPAGGIPRNQILQARHPSLGTTLRKG